MHPSHPAAGGDSLKLAERRTQHITGGLLVPKRPRRTPETIQELGVEERIFATSAKRDGVLQRIDRAPDIPARRKPTSG